MAKVVTGEVRFSYANVFQPRKAQDNATEKYSVAVLIDKKDTDTIKRVKKAIADAAEEGKAKFPGGKIPANYKQPLRDGDDEKPDDEAYAGKLFFNASSTRKPGIVDLDLNPIIDADEFYSGCYGKVSVNFYVFNFNGNKGVGAGLNNIQKTRDGDRLSGGSSAAEDFSTDI